MARDGVRQRFEQGGGFTNPVGQGGAVQIDPLALEYLALPVERQMIGIFIDQHMREQTGAGPAALDRPRRQLGLMECLAASAGHARAHDPVHDETAGDIFQLFGHVLAQLLEPAATRRTGIPRREHGLKALQVIGQRSPLWPAFFSGRCRRGLFGGFFGGARDLFLFQRQLKLVEGL